MEVNGNVKGISRHDLEMLAALADLSVPKHQVCSEELASQLAMLTAAIQREILLYLDRRGKVVYVEVGDHATVPMTDMRRRRGTRRLAGVRCLHSHPSGSGRLSQPDLTSLVTLRLDAMVAIGVTESGMPGSCGLAWGVLGETPPEPLLYPDPAALTKVDFSEKIVALEKDAQGLTAVETLSAGRQKALLVALWQRGPREVVENSLAELAQLADTAGLEVDSYIIQKKDPPSPATYIGKGKAGELCLCAQIAGADCLIFDDELTPVQMRNLEAVTGRAIIDRTMLILDIFAQRARSNEGKLQVELAQLRYMLPRLAGQGGALSRLGGGIGTRGPGETKLEVDRRRIRRRITELEDKLAEAVRTRKLHREKRKTAAVPVVALVGYTNAGKSTLLNALTGAGVLAEDRLFATLDTTMRKITLPAGREVILTDTVGFIRKLPHHLVAAFRATLEEVTEADLLIHVQDATAVDQAQQAQAVVEVLEQLDAAAKPTLIALNKIDLAQQAGDVTGAMGYQENCVPISAKKAIGFDLLLQKMEQLLPAEEGLYSCKIPFTEMALLAAIRREGRVLAETYDAEGTLVKAYLSPSLYRQIEKAGYLQE